MNHLMSMTIEGPGEFFEHIDSERHLLTARQVLAKLDPPTTPPAAPRGRAASSPFHHWNDDIRPKLMHEFDGPDDVIRITVGFYNYKLDDGQLTLGYLVAVYHYTCDDHGRVTMTHET